MRDKLMTLALLDFAKGYLKALLVEDDTHFYEEGEEDQMAADAGRIKEIEVMIEGLELKLAAIEENIAFDEQREAK